MPDRDKICKRIWNRMKKREFAPTHNRKEKFCSCIQQGKVSKLNYNTEYNTLEVRIFNSVLEPRFICRAIRFALQIGSRIDSSVKSQCLSVLGQPIT
jgi:hypothetical protein